jgi:hypothetical protein
MPSDKSPEADSFILQTLRPAGFDRRRCRSQSEHDLTIGST